MRNPKNTRTCLGCLKKEEKSKLIKLVANGEKIELDKSQEKQGRGSYICSSECFLKALNKNFLQQRIRAKMNEQEKENILQNIEKIVKTKEQ